MSSSDPQDHRPPDDDARALGLALMVATFGHSSDVEATLATDCSKSLEALSDADAETLAARVAAMPGPDVDEPLKQHLGRRIDDERPAIARVLAAHLGREAPEAAGPDPAPQLQRWIWKAACRAGIDSESRSGRGS